MIRVISAASSDLISSAESFLPNRPSAMLAVTRSAVSTPISALISNSSRRSSMSSSSSRRITVFFSARPSKRPRRPGLGGCSPGWSRTTVSAISAAVARGSRTGTSCGRSTGISGGADTGRSIGVSEGISAGAEPGTSCGVGSGPADRSPLPAMDRGGQRCRSRCPCRPGPAAHHAGNGPGGPLPGERPVLMQAGGMLSRPAACLLISMVCCWIPSPPMPTPGRRRPASSAGPSRRPNC